MPAPTFPTDEATFIEGLDQGDFAAGGHRTNFIPALFAALALAIFGRDLGTFLQALADQVEEDAASAAAGSGTESSVANIRAGTSAQYLSIRRSYEAAEPVDLTDGATITVDFADGINFALEIGGDRVLGPPDSLVPGKSGLIIVTQDSEGGHGLGKHATWRVMGGEIVLDPVPGGKTVLSYFIDSESSILVTASEGFA